MNINTANIARRIALCGFAALAFTAIIPHEAFAQPDPANIGTWKLNLAKSKYSPGPPPRSVTFVTEAAGQAQRSTFTVVDAEGKRSTQVYMLTFDGKPQPTTGVPGITAGTTTRIDAYKSSFALMNAGNTVRSGTIVRSMDGKTVTIITTGLNDQGKPVNNTAVYEKQ